VLEFLVGKHRSGSMVSEIYRECDCKPFPITSIILEILLLRIRHVGSSQKEW
jgi:hypothetical protein